jgi:hypothetical protein
MRLFFPAPCLGVIKTSEGWSEHRATGMANVSMD